MSVYPLSRFLLVTASTLACVAGLTATANAQTGPDRAENSPGIVVRDDINLNTSPPAGAFDNLVNLTGVGQVATRPSQATTIGLGVCSGTLINPRTVIFAAHCVNTQAANTYGFASGGTAISVGFSANNRPGIRRWLGLDGGARNTTDLATNIYNVEQVWYDPRSVAKGFLEADVALATLDTHADGVPTWTMLFSPLTAETHGIINGYGARGLGANGANLGIDFRRRIAENMISSLSSLDDRNNFLFGPGNVGLPQSVYQLDFDSRVDQAAYNTNPALGPVSYDFDLFNGSILPNEGTTAGGDSGGPLIADRAFDKPVVVGVLSGGSKFFGPQQPFSSYGTSAFYQPLFLFWDQIVANNSYVYANSRPGNRNWNDSNHWIQAMDPNYAIAVDGSLVNALPTSSALGISGDTPKFGTVCFLDECLNLASSGVPAANGPPVFVQGGPGSRGFIPNNVVGNPAAGTKSRYFEVTLNGPGTTSLTSDITIDRLNIGGQSTLDINSMGSLKIWGDYTQTGGWLNVDGTARSGEAFLGFGLLSGNGLFDPTFLTSVGGIIAPGGHDKVGVFTIAADVILSSASLNYFDVSRTGGDKLAIIGDAQNTGKISLGGTAAILNGVGNKSAVFGQTFEIITAQGGVRDRFNTVTGKVGVLYPELEYLPNSVVARMRALQFGDFLPANGIANPYSLAFGRGLDRLRAVSFNDLSKVYAIIDVQEAGQLNQTFQGLSASVAGRATTLDEKQTSRMRTLVSDRLSVLGTAQARGGTLRLLGNGDIFREGSGLTATSASQVSLAQSYQGSTSSAVKLPENVSGFIAAGYTRSSLAGVSNDGRTNEGSWQIASGLEFGLNDRTTLATAFGFAEGEQSFSGGRANVTTNQAVAYGSYRLGGGFYVGGQASFARSRIEASSLAIGNNPFGAAKTSASSLIGEIEAGRNFDLGGVQLTPRASIAYSAYNVTGFGGNGGGDLALAVDNISRNGFEAKAGLKIAGSAKLSPTSSWSLQPEMKLDYVRRLSGNETNLQVRFLAAEAIGINLPVALQDASYGELKGGFKLTNGVVEFGAAVESRIGGQLYRDDRAAVNMAIRF